MERIENPLLAFTCLEFAVNESWKSPNLRLAIPIIRAVRSSDISARL